MMILICIIINSPLIYNTKRQQHEEPIYPSKYKKIDNVYQYLNRNNTFVKNKGVRNFVNKEIFDNSANKKNDQINLISGFETNHDSFKLSNKPALECNNVNADINLNSDIDPDLFDVPSFQLSDYFELNPDELERILNDESYHLNEETFTIKDMDKPKPTNETEIESTSKDKNEFNKTLSIEVIYGESKKNANSDLNELCLTNFNGKNLNKINFFACLECLEPFKYKIEQYIKCNISESYQNFYLQRLNEITNIINLLDKFQLAVNEQKFSFTFNDQKLEYALRLIIDKFDNNTTFNQETYYLFKNELNLRFYKISKSHYYDIDHLSKEKKALKSYYEFMKLYRYVHYVPEILTFGNILTDKFHGNPAFILHLINIFIRKIGKLEENKVFINCLIHKAFSYSPKNCFNLFLVPNFDIKCRIKHKNLHLFSWEFHRKIRQRINQKTKENHNYEIKKFEVVHMKVILLLFLYQHIIFLKHYDIITEAINKLTNFVRRVIKSEECVVCIFDDFLKLVESQTANLK